VVACVRSLFCLVSLYGFANLIYHFTVVSILGLLQIKLLGRLMCKSVLIYAGRFYASCMFNFFFLQYWGLSPGTHILGKHSTS
jgi:hypothetical protein